MGFQKINFFSLPFTKRIALFCISILVALSFGLKMGDNQNTYLLFTLKKIYPNLWERDWLATQTYHYHAVFEYIAFILGSIGNLFWILALLNSFLIALSVYYLFALISHLQLEKPFIVFMFCILFSTFEGTDSIGQSYCFSSVMQPSSIASFFLLMAIYFYIKEKEIFTGITLALSGIFHTNYLILNFPLFMFSDFIYGKIGFIKRSLMHLLPITCVLAAMAPIIMSVSTSPQAEEARRIFQFIVSPNHYVPESFKIDYILFIGWHIFALINLRTFLDSCDNGSRRLVSLYFSATILPVIATMLTTIVYIPFISQLFAFRMAPYSILLARIIGFGGLLKMMSNKTSTDLSFRFKNIYFSILLIDFMLIVSFFIIQYGYLSPKSIIVFIIFSFIIVTVSLAIYWNKNAMFFVKITLIALFLIVTFARLSNYKEKLNLIFGPSLCEAQLYDWVKATDTNSLFLISPDMENFRMFAQRSIVVDWKSTPILPDELIQWYERLNDISGKIVLNRFESVKGFHNLSNNQLNFILSKYNPDYGIFRKKLLAFSTESPIVFQNEQYVVVTFLKSSNKVNSQ
jgi:hypothetical protein